MARGSVDEPPVANRPEAGRARAVLKALTQRWTAQPPRLDRHADSRLTLPQTSIDQRFRMPYRKTYRFSGDYIDNRHRHLARCERGDGMIDLGIPGWLLPADALKLYELVYFCGGDVLELGTYRGLSTVISLEASVSAGLSNTIVSIDLDPASTRAGQATLAGRQGAGRAHFFTVAADQALDTFIGAARTFRFCFIDHSHRYEHVLSTCRRLPAIVEPGSFCLFHDYNDPRNPCPDDDDYGVFQGVSDGLDPALFEFWGIYGCTGLFRKL